MVMFDWINVCNRMLSITTLNNCKTKPPAVVKRFWQNSWIKQWSWNTCTWRLRQCCSLYSVGKSSFNSNKNV